VRIPCTNKKCAAYQLIAHLDTVRKRCGHDYSGLSTRPRREDPFR